MTPQSLIRAALRAGTAIASGETLEAIEEADGLEALNMMLESWFADGIAVFASVFENFTLSAGTNEYTFGNGGDFGSGRPTKVLGGFIRINNQDYKIRIISEPRYMEIFDKTTQSRPQWLYYRPEWPLGVVSLYYSPDQNYDIHLFSEKPVTEVELTADVNFSGVYNEAIKFGLAIRLCTEYGIPTTPDLRGLAKAGKDKIISLNASRQVTPVNLHLPWNHGNYNINADEYGVR